MFTNIFITSFSQYTTICFVSFVSYSVFNEHFFWKLQPIFRDRSLLIRLKFLWLAFFSKKVTGGDDGIRTHDPLLAGQVLSQLSYTPIKVCSFLLFSGLRNGFIRSLLSCVGIELFSRTVSRKVSSPLQSLTSVFGMGTGGPSAFVTLTSQEPRSLKIEQQSPSNLFSRQS